MAEPEKPDSRMVEALRASLKEIERLRERNRALTAEAREPVAIVGAGEADKPRWQRRKQRQHEGQCGGRGHEAAD
ncbi:polyketide synthase docking domain-containing protein, partial [Streptomyces minutiscleroticus]|uniref:polyketide synthase docking domain-containing protein n=1 Tax=Streptomyces minutiscleroticus TaxID=68238 RepID=UPI003329F06A